MYQLVLLAMLSVGAPEPVLLAQAPAKAPGKVDLLGDPIEEPAAAPEKSADGSPAKAAGDAPSSLKEGDSADPTKPATDDAAATEGDTADTEPSEPEDGWFKKMMKQGALGYLYDGGIFMYPILVLGIVGGGVFIERYRSLKMLRTDTGALRSEVHELLQEDRVEEAYRLCDSQQGPVPAILATGLRRFLVLRRLGYDPARIEEQVVKSMDDYSVHIVAALERHLPILATISSVAPMIGFLGTVQGMIVAFANIVAQAGEKNIVELAAEGIQVSLLTTCFGLIVGIPTFMAFNYFTSVINRFVLDVEESATELIEVVTLQMTLQEDAAEGSAEETEVPAYEK